MRLDATDLRYITPDEFRVLSATEVGSKNHEVVPTPLIAQLSTLTGGQVNKLLGSLAKRNLVARVQGAKYDGYRLTYGGLDYLALRTFVKRKPPSVSAVGQKIGVGKESDIYIVQGETAEQAVEKRVLKLQRLGRISFRSIKHKRDYLGKRSSASWMYMSRLAAQKEFAFMKVLYDHGFPVPTPIDQARHCIVMSYVDSRPLRAVMEVPDVAGLYGQLMEMIMRFARAGLIHGDFNEFNILIKRKTYEPIVIDFPQMVSTRHENAEYFFTRDVNCIRKFFRKRFRFEGESWPVWADVLEEERLADEEEKKAQAAAAAGEGQPEAEGGSDGAKSAPASKDPEHKPAGSEDEDEEEQPVRLRLDLAVEASGFGRAMQRELEDYMVDVGEMPNAEQIAAGSDAEDSDSDDDEEYEDYEDSDAEDEEGEEEEQADTQEKDGSAEQAEMSPEDAEAAAAARLEKLRIHRALGNDGDPDDPEPEPEPLWSEEEEEESDSDADSDDSTGVAQTDYTQYVRAPRQRPARMNVSKLGRVDELKETVAKDLERQRRSQTRGTGTKAKVGNQKGHKWKTNAKHVAKGAAAAGTW